MEKKYQKIKKLTPLFWLQPKSPKSATIHLTLFPEFTTIVSGITYHHYRIYLLSSQDLPTLVSGFTYHCLGFTYRHLRIYLPSSRTYLLSSQFYLPSFLGLGSFWLGGLFRELLGGELFLGSLCPHTPKYIYLSKYIYYYHWRRSAVNSAGALRGILGNFHPQKHTYAHCTFHTINFGAGSKKWGCTCTCCTPQFGAYDYYITLHGKHIMNLLLLLNISLSSATNQINTPPTVVYSDFFIHCNTYKFCIIKLLAIVKLKWDFF